MTEEILYREMLEEFLPVFRKLAGTEVYSITLSGSRGKGIADKDSDFDFRIYYEVPAKESVMQRGFEEINCLGSKWKLKNIVVDGIWPRTYAQVEEQLELWLAGKGQPEPYPWTIWGYNILTDIYHEQIVEDPFGRAARWKEQLLVYPQQLKASILQKHGNSLAYWRRDYHYWNKVHRKDTVFLASLTARLVQDMMQVIYALNEFYYPGDGANLKYTEAFACKPEHFEERITEVFHVDESEDTYEIQYGRMIRLIDEVLALAGKVL